jgi:orotate phosphoribosyltransferase
MSGRKIHRSSLTDIPKYPDIPRADDAATRRLHNGIKDIARAVAVQAISRNHDVLFGVYCAGLYHGAVMAKDLKDEAQ